MPIELRPFQPDCRIPYGKLTFVKEVHIQAGDSSQQGHLGLIE
jgi:hypothetical protein